MSIRSVAVGVVVDDPGAAAQTADSVRGLDVDVDVDVVMLDGTAGGPACFNRLAAAATTDAVVFLEGGATMAADALPRLLAALGEPGVGLAGPSTNLAWNEQRAVSGGTGDAHGVGAAAASLLARFGDSVVPLAPLYSIGDFCMAVRRGVLDVVMAADEGFGAGPCWEMEYAARAARAGFDSVWVRAAYVHRRPPSQRRRAEEARLFEASRRRYQDRLCGRRLDGTRLDYADHCAGDACPDFAPASRIVVQLPLPTRAPVAPAPPRPKVRLVSCVMPTADRPAWAARAIDYFAAQTWPAKELVVVDDGEVPLIDAIPEKLARPDVVYVRMASRATIGEKRNLGCSRASGSIVAQWDDDDWYGPERLASQVWPIVDGVADVTALRDAVWFDVERWSFARPSARLHQQLFVGDVHGGTLVFARDVLDRGATYPRASLAEDAYFLREATRRGARLHPVSATGLYLYVRHARNSWQLPPAFVADRGWEAVPEPTELAGDRSFYAAMSPSAPAPTPLRVSCIMPTANRARFVPTAVAAFVAQGYLDRELVVVDDGSVPIEDELAAVPSHLRVRYLRTPRASSLGAKRNLAVAESAGDVVVHWDDDDWSHPERLRAQVEAIATGDADVCGLDTMLWWDPLTGRAWRYACPRLPRPWVAGNTLAYRREAWERAPFPDQDIGEDTAFVWASPPRRVRVLDDERLVVGTVHGSNVSRKEVSGPAWKAVDVAAVLDLIGPAAAGGLRAAVQETELTRSA